MAAPTAPRPRPSRKKPNTRLVMISAAVGGLLILVVSAVLNWPIGNNGSGVGASGKIGSAPATPPVLNAQPASCLDWTESDASDIRPVSCAEPHLFEVTGKADLRAEFGDNADFPSPEQWQQLKQQRCSEVALKALANRVDPNGRFSVGAFTPSEQGWRSGDRTVHCGLQQPGPSGQLYRIVGNVGKLDQSDTYEVGRCLGINGTAVWDPIDCAQPHSVEITGLVDLGEVFAGRFPTEVEQDTLLSNRCGELAAEYAGSPTALADKGLVSYWDTLPQVSWDAGTRRVNCKASAQLPDRSGLAPITGSVKGNVQVGRVPAPANPEAAEPGVPAPGPR